MCESKNIFGLIRLKTWGCLLLTAAATSFPIIPLSNHTYGLDMEHHNRIIRDIYFVNNLVSSMVLCLFKRVIFYGRVRKGVSRYTASTIKSVCYHTTPSIRTNYTVRLRSSCHQRNTPTNL
ncbi:hypothetical protein DFP73DRAFT_27038 [Morchella snyderi]|nr:hypothetical protein DFP73DRAFT_27038 [Morchella snyderi]